MDTFKKGDRVTVFNQTLSGKPIIEGTATILAVGEVEDQYRVSFDNAGLGDSGRNCFRFVVSGEAQDDPKAYIAKAQKDWEEARRAYMRESA